MGVQIFHSTDVFDWRQYAKLPSVAAALFSHSEGECYNVSSYTDPFRCTGILYPLRRRFKRR